MTLLDWIIPPKALRWATLTTGARTQVLDKPTPCRVCGTTPIEVTTIDRKDPSYMPACAYYVEDRP